MSKAILNKYTPLYLTLIITTIVLTVLFLRPRTALGLTVEVDDPVNVRNGLSGFTLDEEIDIHATIGLEGEFETIFAELDYVQLSGGSGFTDVTGLLLPLEPVTGDDLSDQLTQGSLIADVAFTLVSINPFGYPDGSGYGYFQGEDGEGEITY